jgi:broad specificity phosphatase PhoE
MKNLLPVLMIAVLSSCGNKFYVVRHAEKAAVPAGASQMMASDPPLSDAGKQRAIQLRETLRQEHIKYIFSTNYDRTKSTAQPLNELHGATRLQIYNSQKDSMDAFIQKLKRIKKGNVLVVGHSNTIDDIANKLCGTTVVTGDLKDSDYDNLFEIKRKGKKFTFKGKTYGAPTE